MSLGAWPVGIATYANPEPDDSSGWNTLYIVATMAFILMVVTGVAAWIGRRDQRQA